MNKSNFRFCSHLQSVLESKYAELKERKHQQLKEHKDDIADATWRTNTALAAGGLGAAALGAVGGLVFGPAIAAAPFLASFAIEGGTAAAVGVATGSLAGVLATATLATDKIKNYFFQNIRHSK